MVDKLGREIKNGQVVDILVNGIFRGIIVGIREVPIIMPNNQRAPAQIAIQMIVQHVPQDGEICGVYVISEPEEEEKSALTLVQ